MDSRGIHRHGSRTSNRCRNSWSIVLEQAERIQEHAPSISPAETTCSSSAGTWTTPCSLEGSLKLKEISYIHSEAYASGELKHGTISLIVDGTLVIALGTYSPLFDKAIEQRGGGTGPGRPAYWP
ncbi:MAG: SIS domain-containing protein [Dysosmobacter sp.]